MIGFIILTVVSARLIAPGCGQDYVEARGGARTSYRGYDDDDVQLAKPAPTVVPILKQIDRHNDDGSYTYGFEAADGSFKIETKQANGEVKGKYGYTDATGKLHVVEYGANKYGFQPSGEGITVPPINLSVEPEEEEEYAPRPQPQQLRPRPAAVQQAKPWEQERQVRVQAPTQAPVQYRPTQATPHIIYNNEPTPKRPSFFAGAQPVAQSQSNNYDYDDQPIARPVQRPAARPQQQQQQQQPQPARAQTLASFAQPKPQQPTYFVPSSQFRQQIQYAEPAARVSPVDNFQPFRPEPSKINFEQYSEPEPAYRQTYTAPKVVAKSKGGFLDQLQEQFSLPKGGQPTHNVAFGFY